MKFIEWDEEKNKRLKEERGISFEDIKIALEKEMVLDDFTHPNKKRYPNQRILVINIKNYAYYVPYVEDEDKIFLKTIFPSRKATKHYLGGDKK